MAESCGRCGGTILVAQTEDGEGVPLEPYTQTVGEGRYRVLKPGPPRIVELVPVGLALEGFVDHRLDCPEFGNGVR